jgi:hypothetical protein
VYERRLENSAGRGRGCRRLVVGQLLSKFFLEPVHELRKSVGEVRFALAFHGPTIHTPIGRTEEKSEQARQAVLKCSSALIANLGAVPAYAVTRFLAFGALPKRESVEQAAIALRGLATYMHETGTEAAGHVPQVNTRVVRILGLLQLRPLEGEQ